jgi:glycerate dehydrogenase
LLRQADVVSLHLPLAANTRNLFGAREFALMKPDAVLINTARGGIVDESALLAALQSGRLGGAGIDVLAVEPPPADQPLLQADLPNLIVTPHVAWASRAARQRMLDDVAANIRAFARGEARNRVV